MDCYTIKTKDIDILVYIYRNIVMFSELSTSIITIMTKLI